MRHLLSIGSVIALLASLSSAVHAAPTPAGTVISNTATVDGEGDGTPVRSVSNAVHATVLPVCAVSLGPDGTVAEPGQRQTILTGQSATFRYRVTNAGNDRFSVQLRSDIDAASAFVPSADAVTIVADDNANGRVDDADSTVPTGSAITLPAGGSRDLFLTVKTADGSKGAVYANLIARCGQGGEEDRNNVSQLVVKGVPKVTFEKTMTPERIDANGEVTVTLRVKNDGNADSEAVEIADVLDASTLSGLSYVLGSVQAPEGTVEYASNGRWTTNEPVNVTSLRWKLAGVPEGRSLALSFSMKADADAAPGARENTATMTTDGKTLVSKATVTVRANPVLALGPIGNPRALMRGEMSADDTQRREHVVTDGVVCFEHSLQNDGNLADRVRLDVTVEGARSDVALLAMDGTPLVQPVSLAIGQRVNFRACLTPREAGSARLVLKAVSSVGAPWNGTVDVLADIQSGRIGLTKTVEPKGTVARGALLTYTLTATNPFGFPLTDVVLRDVLDANLEFVSATNGGILESGAVTWRLAAVAPQQTVTVKLQARVKSGTPDDTVIPNAFGIVTKEVPTSPESPVVRTPVWTAKIDVVKTVSPEVATVGDRLTWTIRVRNTSATASLRDVAVTDGLPRGVAYLPGSSRLDREALADPTIAGRDLTWTVPSLPAGAEVSISFDTRVLPEAASVGQLVNTVTVRATGSNSEATAQLGPVTATATARIRLGVLDYRAQIIGIVFVDNDRDGVFDAATDEPVARARVLLADGRTALTDAAGRYHFANMPEGMTALRLDPNSVVFTPKRVPQDGGRLGSRGVLVMGLTSVDFPLLPLEGGVAAARDTRFVQGPLTVEKTVTREGDTNAYTVRIVVRSASVLADFALTDPLPEGARLLEGTPTFETSALPAEETTVTYRFLLDSSTLDVVTDPTARWTAASTEGGRP